MLNCIVEEGQGCFLEMYTFRIRFPTRETRWGRLQSFSEIIKYQIVCYIIANTDTKKKPANLKKENVPPILAGHWALLAEDKDLNRKIAMEFLKMTGRELACAANG